MAKDINNLADRLFSSPERINVEDQWEELTEFLLNNQHKVGRENLVAGQSVYNGLSNYKGGKTTLRVFDSTGMLANQTLSNTLQDTVVNPAIKWFDLRYSSDALNEDAEAQLWLEDTSDLMYRLFAESNFYTEVARIFPSLTSLGNAALFCEEKLDEDEVTFIGYKFKALHVSNLAWTENAEGFVDSVYRRFDMTAKQIFERWGERAPRQVLNCLENDPEKEFNITQAIYPRKKSEVKINELGFAAPEDRPIASVYMIEEDVLEEGGYYEMPILVPRWDVKAGERYGRGPGHIALPDVKSLNRLRQRGLEAIDLQVRPPLLVNQRDALGELYFKPGGMSVVRDHTGIREFVSQARTDIFQFGVEDLKNSIESIFFLDRLLLPSRTETGEMTAFEVSQRIQQMQKVLGPQLARLNNELLQPLILRSFNILLRNGVLPEAPEVVRAQGLNLEIVFVNQFARAQQEQEAGAIMQLVQDMSLIAQMKPEILDNLDVDGIARTLGKIRNAPPATLLAIDQVEQLRQARAEQMAQQQAIEQENMMADTNSKNK